MKKAGVITRLLLGSFILLQCGLVHAQPPIATDSTLFFFQHPERILEYEYSEPIPLSHYSQEAFKQQLAWNASEDLLLTSDKHGNLGKGNTYYGIDSLEITPYTWSWVYLESLDSDKEKVRLKLRRPTVWIKKHDVEVIGHKVSLSLNEMGIEGHFEVVDRIPNTFDTRLLASTIDKQGNRYQPIIGVATIEKEAVVVYSFSNGDMLEATKGHVIWSVSEEQWKPISTLNLQEEVKTVTSETTTLISINPIDQPQTVYSLEVYRDHTYFVGDAGILVHNSCIGAALKRLYPNPKKYEEVLQSLKSSGVLKQFLKPNSKTPSELGERFFNLAIKQQDDLLRDITANPKLAHAMADDLKLLKSWTKINKRPALRQDIEFLKSIKALDDAILNVLNDLSSDLLKKLSKDLQSKSNGPELVKILKSVDDIQAYQWIKETPDLAFQLSKENTPYWHKWTTTNFFKFITKKGKVFEDAISKTLKGREQFKKYIDDGYAHFTQVYIKRTNKGFKNLIADDLLVKEIRNVSGSNKKLFRGVINDTKLSGDSPWTPNQRSELLQRFVDPKTKHIDFEVRSHNLPANSPLKTGDVVRVFRDDVYKTFGDGKGKFSGINTIDTILKHVKF